MELIVIIVVIGYIISTLKKATENEMRQDNAKKNSGQSIYQAPKQAARVESPRTQVQQQNSQWQKAAQENIAKAKLRAQQKATDLYEQMNMSELAPKTEKKSAMQQVQASRMEARNTSILQRAKANTDEDKVDVTLETMETEHNHSERVSAAVHHHPEDVITESMLGNVDDLMIKGYDGSLCFERDFVGEGLDMISCFTISTEIQNSSMELTI